MNEETRNDLLKIQTLCKVLSCSLSECEDFHFNNVDLALCFSVLQDLLNEVTQNKNA